MDICLLQVTLEDGGDDSFGNYTRGCVLESECEVGCSNVTDGAGFCQLQCCSTSLCNTDTWNEVTDQANTKITVIPVVVGGARDSRAARSVVVAAGIVQILLVVRFGFGLGNTEIRNLN